MKGELNEQKRTGDLRYLLSSVFGWRNNWNMLRSHYISPIFAIRNGMARPIIIPLTIPRVYETANFNNEISHEITRPFHET